MAGRAGKRRRVLRGGSFNNNEDNARATYRNNNTPNNEWNNNGFRCGVGGVAFHVSPCSTVSGHVPCCPGQQCDVFTDTAPRPNCREIAPAMSWPQSCPLGAARAKIE